jgi:hypothetical protein
MQCISVHINLKTNLLRKAQIDDRTLNKKWVDFSKWCDGFTSQGRMEAWLGKEHGARFKDVLECKEHSIS